MTALTKIKDEFQNDYASQIAAVRSDVKQLRTDILTLRDDLVDDAHAVKRLGKRAGRELRARGEALEEKGRRAVSTVTQEVQQHPLASAAIASALVFAVSAIAYWSTRHSVPT
jgi:Skp family chaperone for outer membrane proteins